MTVQPNTTNITVFVLECDNKSETGMVVWIYMSQKIWMVFFKLCKRKDFGMNDLGAYTVSLYLDIGNDCPYAVVSV